MAKKSLFVSFVLDETGSMQCVKQQTISGFNEYVDTLKKERGSNNIKFTLTQFNSSRIKVVYDGIALDDVVPLNDDSYRPSDLTPLYDAIGKTISALEGNLGKKKANVLVVIQTDGQENASSEYTQQNIFQLISKKKAEGWTFAFLGADQDAWLASQQIGISRGNTMIYKGSETLQAFAASASATVSYSRSGGTQTNSLFEDED